MGRRLFEAKEREREKVSTPVYTATYKVNRSDTLLEFLLRKCNTSRNNEHKGDQADNGFIYSANQTCEGTDCNDEKKQNQKNQLYHFLIPPNIKFFGSYRGFFQKDKFF